MPKSANFLKDVVSETHLCSVRLEKSRARARARTRARFAVGVCAEFLLCGSAPSSPGVDDVAENVNLLSDEVLLDEVVRADDLNSSQQLYVFKDETDSWDVVCIEMGMYMSGKDVFFGPLRRYGYVFSYDQAEIICVR